MKPLQRISSGGIYEKEAAYCRAVVAGGFVFVAGTTAQGRDIPDDVIGQCQSALDTIGQTLAGAGSNWENVVRVVYYLPNRHDFKACWPVLRDRFGDNPPAGTIIEAGLIDPRYKIEIEVTALVA